MSSKTSKSPRLGSMMPSSVRSPRMSPLAQGISGSMSHGPFSLGSSLASKRPAPGQVSRSLHDHNSSAKRSRPVTSSAVMSSHTTPSSHQGSLNILPSPTLNPTMYNHGMGLKGIPSIHTACIDGNLRMIQQLVHHRPGDSEATDIVGSRPLHIAACYGHINVIEYLISLGVDIDARDFFKSSPLCVTSAAEAVELLVSYGANVDIRNLNNMSPRSISMSNPYVALAIKNGLKKLEQRKRLTKRILMRLKSPDDPLPKEENNEKTVVPNHGLSPSLPALSLSFSPLNSSMLAPSLPDRFRLDGKPTPDSENGDKADGFPPSVSDLIVEYLYHSQSAQPHSSPSARLHTFSDEL